MCMYAHPTSHVYHVCVWRTQLCQELNKWSPPAAAGDDVVKWTRVGPRPRWKCAVCCSAFQRCHHSPVSIYTMMHRCTSSSSI